MKLASSASGSKQLPSKCLLHKTLCSLGPLHCSLVLCTRFIHFCHKAGSLITLGAITSNGVPITQLLFGGVHLYACQSLQRELSSQSNAIPDNVSKTITTIFIRHHTRGDILPLLLWFSYLAAASIILLFRQTEVPVIENTLLYSLTSSPTVAEISSVIFWWWLKSLFVSGTCRLLLYVARAPERHLNYRHNNCAYTSYIECNFLCFSVWTVAKPVLLWGPSILK